MNITRLSFRNFDTTHVSLEPRQFQTERLVKVLDRAYINSTWLRARLNDYGKAQGGASAVEFAFVALPFFWLIFVILELCIIFIVHLVIDHAAEEAKRKVMIGFAQQNNWGEAEFRDEICTLAIGIIDCSELRIFTDFDPSCLYVEFPSSFNGFGGGDNCVLIRVEYDWPLFVPSLTSELSGAGNDSYLMIVHALSINEAF